MLRNYLVVAFRNLKRHKLFSAINTFCLAIGLTFSMIIGVYVIQQESVNEDIKNIHQDYLIKSTWKQANMGIDITTLGPLAKTMRDEYPSLVANFYRFDPVANIVSVGEKHFREDISVGDSTLVTMFGFPLLYGNPQKAFLNNQSAVVTEDFAIKYFGQSNVLNKVITIQTPSDGGKHDFTISAVLRKMPFNSVANFAVAKTEYQVYLPMYNNQYFQGGDKGDNWANIFMVGIIQLQKNISPKDLEIPFQHTLAKYQPDFIKGNLKVELASLGNYQLESNNKAIQKMIRTLALIASLILILAIINFVNINIGTSSYRLKEIALRKVFGSPRAQLIIQFITESVLLTFIASLISIVAYQILLPIFNQVLHTTLDPFWQFDSPKIVFLATLTLTIGVISGIYPAIILSSLNIITSVRGKINSTKGGAMFRKTLLIVQFALAITVFICALNVSKQMGFFFKKDLGYQRDQVMIISSVPRNWDSVGVIKMENIKSQLMQMPAVKSICLSYDVPDGGGGFVNAYPEDGNSVINMQLLAADDDYAKVYSVQTKEGAFLNDGSPAYLPGRVVLNETAVKALGWKNAVGKTIHLGASNGLALTVVGVVRDFHYESLQRTIQPLIIANLNEPFTRSYRYFSVKLSSPDINGSIAALQNKWKTIFPDAGFEYTFMDQKFQSLYKTETQLRKAANIATVLNLTIVFMGVFGVVSFTLTRRTKEIAVRKVLGADVKDVLSLFMKDYVWLILIANVVAWPLAYMISNKWLEEYAYRIEQNGTPYFAAIGLIFIMVFGLIALQSFKTAVENPVKSLRTE